MSRINTVVVAAITSNPKYEAMPGNVALSRGESGIPKASVINISQLRAIDRSYIESRIGSLRADKLRLVKDGVRILFEVT